MTTSIDQVADMIAKLGGSIATLAADQGEIADRLLALEMGKAPAGKASNGKAKAKAKAPAKLAIDFQRIEGYERTTTKEVPE